MSTHPSPNGRLRGQTMLVTGTTKGGIGYETARLLGDEGATVLTHARTPQAARAPTSKASSSMATGRASSYP